MRKMATTQSENPNTTRLLQRITSIRFKLLVLCFGLVIVPTVSLGIFSYNIQKEDTYEKLQKKLKVIAKDWYLITKQYIRENDRILKREEVLVEKHLRCIALNSKKMVNLATASDGSWISADVDRQLYDELASIRIGRSGSVIILDQNLDFLVSRENFYEGSRFTDHLKDEERIGVLEEIERVRDSQEDDDTRTITFFWRSSPERPYREMLGVFTYLKARELFVGAVSYYTDFRSVKLEKALQQELRYLLAEQQIGNNGNIWVLNGEGIMILSRDHYRDGQNIISVRNRKGEYFVKNALATAGDKQSGEPHLFTYYWKNIGEQEERKKISAIVYIAEWDWYIGVSAYYDEFLQSLKTIKIVMATVCILAIIIGSTIAYLLATRLIRPIRVMEKISAAAAEGNLQVGMDQDLLTKNDELGTLARSFDKMIRNLREKIYQLEEERNRFDDVVDNAEEWIWEMDESGRYVYSSPVGEQMHGYEPEKLLQMRCQDLFHPDTVQAESDTILESMNAHRPFREQESMCLHKDGSALWFLSSGVPVVDRSGKVRGYRGSTTNITQRKKEEQEMVLLEQELNQSKKLEALGTLAAGIAHEINSPTQFIYSNIDFLNQSFTDIQSMIGIFNECIELAPENVRSRLEQALDEGDWDFLHEEIPLALAQAREGLDRVSSIVQAMKKFSHPGSVDKARVSINESIETTIVVARNEWKYVAEVAMDLDPANPTVLCHVNEINQTILNLLINSAHAIRDSRGEEGEKGKIILRTFQQDGMLTLTISDNGHGIPEEIQEKVFDPFFTTKEVGKGTGQGLSIAYQTIVEHHQGKVWFETSPDSGTTFYIQLPTGNDA